MNENCKFTPLEQFYADFRKEADNAPEVELSKEDPEWGNVSKYIVKEEIPDIRNISEEEKLGSSGAEPLFCDSTQCKIDKDKIFAMAGLESYNDLIVEDIHLKVQHNVSLYVEIQRKIKEMNKNSKLIEGLLLNLGYENVTWNNEKTHISAKSPGVYGNEFRSGLTEKKHFIKEN